jgi:hypothetical protein
VIRFRCRLFVITMSSIGHKNRQRKEFRFFDGEISTEFNFCFVLGNKKTCLCVVVIKKNSWTHVIFGWILSNVCYQKIKVNHIHEENNLKHH